MKNKGFKVTAIILALAIYIIAHPFSIVYALSPVEYITGGSGTNNGISYRWDRYVWCNDPNESTDPIQVEVDGNTFWACEYTVFEVYFQNPASGTFRVNKPSSGNMSNYTFYVNGGICSSKMTAYMTIKFTNVTHVKVVITSYNQNVYADPNQVFSLGTFSLSSPTDSTQTTLNDIDILLANVDYSLQDILGYINGSNGILDYLDQIETYSEYLQNISLDLSNIDNTIDTITWNTIPISYHGWTSDFSSFTTGQSTKKGGYYYFSNVDINANNIHSIFKLTVPLVSTYITDDTIRFGTYTFRGLVNIPVTEFMMYKSGENMIIYFILDTSSGIFIENTSLILYCSDQTKINSYYDNVLSLKYIDQNDIEYWTIRNAIYTHTNQKLLKQIVDGITDNSTQNSISDITDDLNDQITASNSAASSTEALLENFNQNIDLTDYNFSISTGDHVIYFKQKLTDIYEIDEFKPFYLIPIILFILGRILAG